MMDKLRIPVEKFAPANFSATTAEANGVHALNHIAITLGAIERHLLDIATYLEKGTFNDKICLQLMNLENSIKENNRR